LIERIFYTLRPEGIAYSEIPNYDCIYRKLNITSWKKINVTPGHWHIINNHSLISLCENGGLDTIWVRSFF